MVCPRPCVGVARGRTGRAACAQAARGTTWPRVASRWAASRSTRPISEERQAAREAEALGSRVITHVVIMKPRADLAPGEREAFVEAFEHAVREISAVRAVRIGRRVTH